MKRGLAIAESPNTASEDVQPLAMTQMTRRDPFWKKLSLGYAVHRVARLKLMCEFADATPELRANRSLCRIFEMLGGVINGPNWELMGSVDLAPPLAAGVAPREPAASGGAKWMFTGDAPRSAGIRPSHRVFHGR
jgi:hypothetical protein